MPKKRIRVQPPGKQKIRMPPTTNQALGTEESTIGVGHERACTFNVTIPTLISMLTMSTLKVHAHSWSIPVIGFQWNPPCHCYAWWWWWWWRGRPHLVSDLLGPAPWIEPLLLFLWWCHPCRLHVATHVATHAATHVATVPPPIPPPMMPPPTLFAKCFPFALIPIPGPARGLSSIPWVLVPNVLVPCDYIFEVSNCWHRLVAATAKRTTKAAMQIHQCKNHKPRFSGLCHYEHNYES